MVSPPAPEPALHRALIELCWEHGYRRFDLAALCDRSGIDRGEFDRHYSDLDDCFCSLLDRIGEEFHAHVFAAVGSEGDWRRQMRATSAAMAVFFLADRPRARVMLIDAFTAGERAQLIRDRSMKEMVALIDRGREQPGAPASLTEATAQAIAGTVYEQLCALARRDADLAEWWSLAPDLMYSVVLPYLGPQAAAEELTIAPFLAARGVGGPLNASPA